MKENKSGIYKITSPSGRVYIGQSVDIERRWLYYKRCKSNSQIRLNSSFKKYGVEKHKFEIIEECCVNQLNNRERYWQEYYNVLDQDFGLNCRVTKSSDKSGYFSKESRKRLSDAIRGRKSSESTKKKLSKMKKGELNNRAILVLNMETGIYYGTIKEAASTINLTGKNLEKRLRGVQYNNTSFAKVSKNGNFIEESECNVRPNLKLGNNPQAKIILSLDDGIYYNSIQECANAYEVSIYTVQRICSKTFNTRRKLNLIYA